MPFKPFLFVNKGHGEGWGRGAEATDPRNLQGGAGPVPSKDIFDLVQPFHEE